MTIYITTPDRTTTFSATRDDFIKAALRKIDAIGEGEQPSVEGYTTAAFALNVMIKAWGKDGFQLWKLVDLPVPLLSGVNTYYIGPTATGAGAVVSDRPLRVIDSSYVRDSAGLDTSLKILSRQEYNQLGLKSTSSTVSQIFYDPQLSNGILKVYGTPSDSDHVAYLTVQMPVYDFNLGTEVLDFPQEGYQDVVYGLAAELLEEYPGLPSRKEDRIIQKAEFYKNQLCDWSQEETSIFIQPSPEARQG